LAKSTILLVEDDPSQRLLFATELENEGYRVVCAQDGYEALDKFDEERPDLVVLDIRLPGMDGMEAMGKILARYENTPVILHTAYAVWKDNFRSWAADHYVVKSSDLSELKAKIKETLDRRSDRRSVA
jgi:DNA-binding response OmpR family regulator